MIRRLLAARPLRGFITVPGAVSLAGMLLSLITIWADNYFYDVSRIIGVEPLSSDVSSAVLSTLAGAAMTALSLVYSIVLVVFTLAAGNIAPRLLDRFSDDRTNQIAVGTLGALFLHSLLSLAAQDGRPAFLTVAVAIALAVSSVLLLLLFVDKVARRVTIDEEIAAIADGLEASFTRRARLTAPIRREDVVRPMGEETVLRAPRSGYITEIDYLELAALAQRRQAFVDLTALPGDHLLKGDPLAHVIARDGEAMCDDVGAVIVMAGRRTSQDDIRFSINLLIEIALRALSPGVNDSFTAIACIDRLTATFAKAAETAIGDGVYCDDQGAARVVAPAESIGALLKGAFGPLRRASRNNVLVAAEILRALSQLAPRLDGVDREAAEAEIALMKAELDAADALQADKNAALDGMGPLRVKAGRT